MIGEAMAAPIAACSEFDTENKNWNCKQKLCCEKNAGNENIRVIKKGISQGNEFGKEVMFQQRWAGR